MTIVNQAPGSVRSSRSAVPPDPEWKNEQLMVVAGVEFFVTTDLADRPKMKSILDEEFPDRNIDLVIDDASHFYQETRSSFNSIFPYLKPGGIYIVEDWGWAHWPGDTWQKSQAIPTWRPALSNLLFEICVLSASSSDLVAEVRVNSMSFMVRKGEAEMPREDFDLGGYTLTRDHWFKPSL
jgi:SAM-dependent methyltransferase